MFHPPFVFRLSLCQTSNKNPHFKAQAAYKIASLTLLVFWKGMVKKCSCRIKQKYNLQKTNHLQGVSLLTKQSNHACCESFFSFKFLWLLVHWLKDIFKYSLPIFVNHNYLFWLFFEFPPPTQSPVDQREAVLSSPSHCCEYNKRRMGFDVTAAAPYNKIRQTKSRAVTVQDERIPDTVQRSAGARGNRGLWATKRTWKSNCWQGYKKSQWGTWTTPTPWLFFYFTSCELFISNVNKAFIILLRFMCLLQ